MPTSYTTSWGTTGEPGRRGPSRFPDICHQARFTQTCRDNLATARKQRLRPHLWGGQGRKPVQTRCAKIPCPSYNSFPVPRTEQDFGLHKGCDCRIVFGSTGAEIRCNSQSILSPVGPPEHTPGGPFLTAPKLNDLLAVARRLAKARSGCTGCACSRALSQVPRRAWNEAETCSPRAFQDSLAFLDPQVRALGTRALPRRRERPDRSDSCSALHLSAGEQCA